MVASRAFSRFLRALAQQSVPPFLLCLAMTGCTTSGTVIQSPSASVPASGSGSGGSSSGSSGSSGSGSSGSGSSGSGSSGSNAGSTVTLPSIHAIQSDSLVDSIGVNTHLAYTNTAYASQWPEVLSALQALGVRHIRDGYHNWLSGNTLYAEHAQLAAAGIHCNFVVPIDSATTPALLENFSSLATDLESLEGPNECDANNGQNCGGRDWAANLLAFLPTIREAGQDLGVPVLGPSLTMAQSYTAVGNISGQMTQNNLHVYFGGRNPESQGWGNIDAEGHGYGSFAWWLDNAAIDGPGRKSTITESGYISSSTGIAPYTIPQAVEALYAPRTLLMAFKSGIARTYLYELLDEVSSPGYGLMNSGVTPKPAYTAIQNLIALTADQGPSFTPGSLEYQIDGGTSGLEQLLLQKRDGTFLLILWLGESSYDEATNVATAVTNQAITLDLAGNAYTKDLYEFTDSGAVTTKSLSVSQSLPLTVTDAIAIVEIGAK